MNKPLPRWSALLVSASLLGAATAPMLAYAANVGEEAPNARVEDAEENTLWLSSLRGAPVIVFYEDKDSGEINRALKDELAALMGEDGMGAIRAIPVADVSDYDNWPARGFVKDAIREESKKAGLTIYCDWNASFRTKLDLAKGTSNVVVIGRDGRVKFSSAGRVLTAKRAEVLAMLRSDAQGK